MNREQLKVHTRNLEDYSDHVLALVLAQRLHDQAKLIASADPGYDPIPEETASGENHIGNQPKQPPSGYPMTCHTCGKRDTVKFKPRNDNPLYCQDCYNNR